MGGEFSAVPNPSADLFDPSSPEDDDGYSETPSSKRDHRMEEINVSPLGLDKCCTILSNFAGNFHSEKLNDRFCCSTFSDINKFRIERHFSSSVHSIHETFQFLQEFSGNSSSLVGIKSPENSALFEEEPNVDTVFESSSYSGSIFVSGDNKVPEIEVNEEKQETSMKEEHEYKPNFNLYDSLVNFGIYFIKNIERKEKSKSLEDGYFQRPREKMKMKLEVRKVIIALIKTNTIQETQTSKSRTEVEVMEILTNFTRQKSPKHFFFVVQVGKSERSSESKNPNQRKFDRVCRKSGIRVFSISEFGDLHMRLGEILDIISKPSITKEFESKEQEEDGDGESTSGLSDFSDDEEEEEEEDFLKPEDVEKKTGFSEIYNPEESKEGDMGEEEIRTPVDVDSREFSVDWGVLLDLS